jgi:uncharacterized repeat protein (TIGR04052 family)
VDFNAHRPPNLNFAGGWSTVQRSRAQGDDVVILQRSRLRGGSCGLLAVVAAALLAAVGPAAAGHDGSTVDGQRVADRNGDRVVTAGEIGAPADGALKGSQLVPVTVRFRGMVGAEPFVCGNRYHGIGSTHKDFIPADFRFYVHDVRLRTADGKEVPLRLDQDGVWQYRNVALLDFENKVSPCNDGTPQTNVAVHGVAAPLTYTGVRFFLGVPFEMDHVNAATAPSPLNLDGMFWSWQDGYKFLRIDAAFDSVRVHIGSTGCVLGPHRVVVSCGRPNVAEINLDHFDPSKNVIAADIAALLSDSDLGATRANTPPGCQSDPGDTACVPIFKNIGINLGDGSPTPGSQKFFRVQ